MFNKNHLCQQKGIKYKHTRNLFPCHNGLGANKAITIDSFQAIHQTTGMKNKVQLSYKQNNKEKGS